MVNEFKINKIYDNIYCSGGNLTLYFLFFLILDDTTDTYSHATVQSTLIYQHLFSLPYPFVCASIESVYSLWIGRLLLVSICSPLNNMIVNNSDKSSSPSS